MKSLLIVGVLSGCVRADVITCGDEICPTNALCVPDEHRCVDPNVLDVEVSPLAIAVDCGASAERIVPLRNFGTEPLAFTARSTAQGILPTPTDGVVPPGGTVDLHIVADPGPISIPGSDVDGILTIATDIGTHSIPVLVTTHGALARIRGSFDFGDSRQNVAKDQTVIIRNDGDQAMDVTLADLPATFTSLTPTTAHVEPVEEASFTVQFLPPALATYGGMATLAIEGHLCQPVPPTLNVVGTASGLPLLVGQTMIAFEPVACSEPARTLQLGLVNNLAATQDVAVSLADASLFSTLASVSIAGSSDALLPITRRATTTEDTVGAHDTTLVLTGAVTKTVTVSQPIVAPVLSVDNRVVPLASPGMLFNEIMVTNSGNAIANVKIEPATWNHDGVVVTISPATLQVPPGVTLPVTFSLSTQSGAQSGVYKGTISAIGECSKVPLIVAPYTITP